ncbi:MAG TPA: Gx transporter family protein, partial [Thermoanaerobacterales bacterium]|nr:Gx transporter family protein [Thermoanaerobacterales bacterium]
MRRLVHLSLLVSFGIVLHIIETFIPLPIHIPGAKLGLANIVTLLALVIYGFKYGLVVSIMRCLVSSLITGSISGLIYSLSGAIISLIMMFLALYYGSKVFSLIGVSIIGAQFHILTQISIASIILQNLGIFLYLPFLMIVSLFTGYFVGLTSGFTYKILHK